MRGSSPEASIKSVAASLCTKTKIQSSTTTPSSIMRLPKLITTCKTWLDRGNRSKPACSAALKKGFRPSTTLRRSRSIGVGLASALRVNSSPRLRATTAGLRPTIAAAAPGHLILRRPRAERPDTVDAPRVHRAFQTTDLRTPRAALTELSPSHPGRAASPTPRP